MKGLCSVAPCAFLALLLLAAPVVVGAERPAYGAAAFLPSPSATVCFRADGNGDFSGARPVLRWREAVPGASGPSRNIAWKSPVAGWSLAPPTVVGRRVFAVGEPDVLMCFDAGTGEELWRRRLIALAVGDRRVETVYDVLRASAMLLNAFGRNVGDGEVYWIFAWWQFL